MSVLQLRRDMVVVEEEPAVEIDKPFPLRTIEADAEIAEVTEIEPEETEETEEHPRKSLFKVMRWWLNAAIVVIAVLAYPVAIMMASDVGDGRVAGIVDRTKWTAPWAGAAATLMEKHFNDLGWANDASSWTPMARLTGKPAYQTAMAGSVGEFATLQAKYAASSGEADPDLSVASRLISANSTAIQLRAARDALVNYDRRMRRRFAAPVASEAQLIEQLALIDTWAVKSQAEIAGAAALGGGLVDNEATRSVYAAKGRAMAAYVFLDATSWPESSKAADARSAALEAWRVAAQFHPMVVLNGSPDGSVFGNHAASMGFLIAQAQKATAEFKAAVSIPNPAPVLANAAPTSVVK
jgi:hypothetical protein